MNHGAPSTLLRDIDSRADIDALIAAFYARATTDEVIGFFFTDVVQLDLAHHLPLIGDFWETILFGTDAYRKHGRSPVKVHAALHARAYIEPRHFARWLELFTTTVDAMFVGPRAHFAKQRSQAIARRIAETLAAVGRPA